MLYDAAPFLRIRPRVRWGPRPPRTLALVLSGLGVGCRHAGESFYDPAGKVMHAYRRLLALLALTCDRAGVPGLR